MYYQNGNYMQDLNYYNQTPNYGYNPYGQTNYQPQSMNGNGMPQMTNAQNLSAMYPAVYRIISPVVSQVLANCNTNYITEETLNNMVDTVYNMVEGDINLTDTTNTNPTTSTENTSGNTCERTSSTQRQNTSTATTSGSNRQSNLLRDLIRIMILNEIICRRQNQTMTTPMMMQNTMQTSMANPMNQQMYR